MTDDAVEKITIRLQECDIGEARIPIDPEKETTIIIHEDENSLSE